MIELQHSQKQLLTVFWLSDDVTLQINSPELPVGRLTDSVASKLTIDRWKLSRTLKWTKTLYIDVTSLQHT